MFNKQIAISPSLEIVFHFRIAPFFQNEKRFFFGFPFNLSQSLAEDSIGKITNDLKGYWLFIDITEDHVNIVTDILGGLRVYYTQTQDKLILSDDYLFIENQLQNKTVNSIEVEFWKKHGFTSGKGTFLDQIQKISPSSILSISDKGIFDSSYFKDIQRESDSNKHMHAVHADIKDTFDNVKKLGAKTILLFSGGKDSYFLLQYLLERQIDFDLVFFKLNPMNQPIAHDLSRARSASSQLGIELKEIEIKLSEISAEDKLECVKHQVLDKHYSLLHYFGMKSLKEIYGEEVIVINGQSSDSILSLGPSEESLMSYFRRKILYFPSSFTSKIGLQLLCVKAKKRFRLPKTKQERLLALFDEFKYSRVIELSKSKAYYKYISEYLDEKTEHLKHFSSQEMYAKILSFCQGSDNQVVVNSAIHNGMKVIMPFATPALVYGTVQYKDESLEVSQPKYVIDLILQEENQFKCLDLVGQGRQKEMHTEKLSDASMKEMDFLFREYISKHYQQK